MISKSLSTSRKFAALFTEAGELAEFSQTLFMLLVTHSDDYGRLPGDVFTVKHLVFPTSPRSLEEFTQALEALNRVKLVKSYHSKGSDCIQIEQFDDHQMGLHKRVNSRLPEPEFPEVPGISGNFQELPPELNRTEQNRTEQNRTKYIVRETRTEEEFFQIFRDAYPAQRRVGGQKARLAFRYATQGRNGQHFDTMMKALEQHKRSQQWKNAKYIPMMTTWLNQERWTQQLEEQPEGRHGKFKPSTDLEIDDK